jgi:cell wall-associated NlpC family hydrolase
VSASGVRLVVAAVALGLVLAGCAAQEPPTPRAPKAPKATVMDTVRAQLGVPYRNGGDTPRVGFDCSGLVQWSFAQHGIPLPRRTEDQLKAGRPVSKGELAPGDLVFFNVTSKRWGLHVGVYSGQGRFIHAPTAGSRVREESLFERYWVRTYIGARRVLEGP